MSRLKSKLAADGTTFQSKAQALLEEYEEGPAAEREEIQRQVAAARAAMRRYAPAMRETRALKEPVWVKLDAVPIFHEENLLEFGGASGIRDRGAIESALTRPQNLFAYEQPPCANVEAFSHPHPTETPSLRRQQPTKTFPRTPTCLNVLQTTSVERHLP